MTPRRRGNVHVREWMQVPRRDVALVLPAKLQADFAAAAFPTEPFRTLFAGLHSRTSAIPIIPPPRCSHTCASIVAAGVATAPPALAQPMLVVPLPCLATTMPAILTRSCLASLPCPRSSPRTRFPHRGRARICHRRLSKQSRNPRCRRGTATMIYVRARQHRPR